MWSPTTEESKPGRADAETVNAQDTAGGAVELDAGRRRQSRRRKRLAAVAALTLAALVALVGGALAWNSHVQGVYTRKDDAYRALAIRTDKDRRAEAAAHERKLAD